MNEKVVKKMAEVRAFVNLADKIVQNSGSNLREQFQDIVEALESIHEYSDYDISDESLKDVFDEKQLRTVAKLDKMMSLYIGDEWDNPIEVLEWLSFYSGSASAHASFTLGGLKESDSQDDNYNISKQLSEIFWDLLVKVKASLFEAGAKAAKNTN
jgi:hypothetical protein